MYGAPPPAFEVAGRAEVCVTGALGLGVRRCIKNAAPVRSQQLESALLGRTGEHRQQLDLGAAEVQRSDQRLEDRHGAVMRADIAPRLQIMRLVQVPVAQRGGFVEM